MKSLILYGSPHKLTKSHKLVTHQISSKLCPVPKYYVRAKVFHGDTLTALDKAKPLPGETILNTVEFPQ